MHRSTYDRTRAAAHDGRPVRVSADSHQPIALPLVRMVAPAADATVAPIIDDDAREALFDLVLAACRQVGTAAAADEAARVIDAGWGLFRDVERGVRWRGRQMQMVSQVDARGG